VNYLKNDFILYIIENWKMYCPVTLRGTQIFLFFREAVANIMPNELIRYIFAFIPLLLARKYTIVLYNSRRTYDNTPFAQIRDHWPNDLPHEECAVLWFRIAPKSYYFNKKLFDWQEEYLKKRFCKIYSHYLGEPWTTHWRFLSYHIDQLFHLSIIIPGRVTRKREKIINSEILPNLLRAMGGGSYYIID
jgi:hypothetical protein